MIPLLIKDGLMPRYRSRSKSERKHRKVARAKVPREKRKLLQWAAGTSSRWMEDLSNATRATMTRALHEPQAHLGALATLRCLRSRLLRLVSRH